MVTATAAAAAAAAAAKYQKMSSYSETIQECMRYVNVNTTTANNNNNNNSQNNIINPNLDPLARQRLITNLMRQFNSNQNANIYNTNNINQTAKQLFNNSQLFNGFTSSPNDSMLHHQQLSPSLIQSNNSSSASSSIPSSPDTSNSSSPTSESKSNNNVNQIRSNNFRRSSVSPISAASSCSSSSSKFKKLRCQNHDSNNNNNNTNEMNSTNSNLMCNVDSEEMGIDSNSDQNVWRPW